MKTVLMRLEGPLQSWGTRSRFKYRDTELEPSKSGVLGLVGAAMGMPRDDVTRLAHLAAVRMGVRVDSPGRVIVDYHTAGAGTFRGEPHHVFGSKHPVVTHREYLVDASFLVALSFDDEALATEVHQRLVAPMWPLFLGRRSCAPSLPIAVGTADVDMVGALAASSWPGETRPSQAIKMVIESGPGPDTEVRDDQPLSFRLGDRHYARRHVRTQWLDPSQLVLQAPDCPSNSIVDTVWAHIRKQSHKAQPPAPTEAPREEA